MAVSWKPMGRYGNWCFQCATAFAYAKKHNLEFIVPNRTNDKKWNPLYLQHLAKPLPPKPNVTIYECGHAYQEIPFGEDFRSRNVILQGYWQSEKYFGNYREEILELFDAPKVNQYGYASIHLRFGDYKLYPEKHPPMNPQYYGAATFHLYKERGISKFRVFSDDISEARKVLSSWQYSELRFEYISGNDEVTDIKKIAECEHHVNSSSTFAWWGSWLNPNKDKMIITPRDWFVFGHGGLNTDDIIPDTWIKI